MKNYFELRAKVQTISGKRILSCQKFVSKRLFIYKGLNEKVWLFCSFLKECSNLVSSKQRCDFVVKIVQ